MRKMEVMLISVVVGHLDTVSNGLKKKLGSWKLEEESIIPGPLQCENRLE